MAAGAFVPLFGLSVYRILPIAGALAMGLSSTTVVLASLALRWGTVGPTARIPAPVPPGPSTG